MPGHKRKVFGESLQKDSAGTTFKISENLTGITVNQTLRALKMGPFLVALLIAAWALAIGLHDLVLSDHDHDRLSPEWTIAQAWSSSLPPVKPHSQTPSFLALLLTVVWVVVRRPQPTLQPCLPEWHHSPPRPPTLKNLLYRGPPSPSPHFEL